MKIAGFFVHSGACAQPHLRLVGRFQSNSGQLLTFQP